MNWNIIFAISKCNKSSSFNISIFLTPTYTVCLSHQHEALYVMLSLVKPGLHEGRMLGPVMEILAVSVITKYTKIHCPVQNRTESRQTCGCQLALLTINHRVKLPLVGILELGALFEEH